MIKFTQKDLTKMVNTISKFYGITPPKASFATAAELGRTIQGMFLSHSYEICIRRNPNFMSKEFLIAHELAHAWQYVNKQPYDENQADEMAGNCLNLNIV